MRGVGRSRLYYGLSSIGFGVLIWKEQGVVVMGICLAVSVALIAALLWVNRRRAAR
jgi:hypothetical protein